MDQNVNENMKNPWFVSSMFDFCYFCCPECEDKSQSKEDFVLHASEYHDGAVEGLIQITDGSLDDINIKDFVRHVNPE